MIPIIFTSGIFVSSFISNYIYQYFTQKQVLSIFQGLSKFSKYRWFINIWHISHFYFCFTFS